MKLAHRVSYELFSGPVPANREVCHACDNPSCVEPRHLFLGTRLSNEQDKDKKGRRKVGEQVRTAKLTEEDVRAILRLHDKREMGIRRLSKRFAVSKETIRNIVNRKKWRHVQ